MRELLQQARDALQTLHDEQNDAPLEQRRAQWEAAMRRAISVITVIDAFLDAALAAAPAQPDEREALQELIADFRLSNWTDEQGDGLPLVDRITSGGDIGAGMEQIELLADEIACFYADRALLATPAPAQPVAWMTEMACSSPVVTDAFLKQYPQHRSTYTIPLYAALPQEAQRTLGAKGLEHV